MLQYTPVYIKVLLKQVRRLKKQKQTVAMKVFRCQSKLDRCGVVVITGAIIIGVDITTELIQQKVQDIKRKTTS